MTWDDAASASISPAEFNALSLQESFKKLRSLFNSKNENQRQIAFLIDAVESTMRERGISEFTPIAYFATLLTLLDQQKGRPDRISTRCAICYLLAVVMPKLQSTVLKTKHLDVIGTIATVLQTDKENSSTTLSCIACVENVLLAFDGTIWNGTLAKDVIDLVFQFCADERTKVRKKCHDAIRRILHHPPPPMSTHPMSRHIGDLCVRLLETSPNFSPEKALHVLSLLKLIVGDFGDNVIEPLCDILFALPGLNNPVITDSVFKVFGAVLSQKAESWDSQKIAVVLDALMDLKPHFDDQLLSPTWIDCVTKGFLELAKSNPLLCSTKVPEIITDHIFPMYQTKSAATISAATTSITSLVRSCLPDTLIEQSLSSRHPSGIQNIVSTIESGLGVLFQASWGNILRIFEALFERLGDHADAFMGDVLQILDMYRRDESFDLKSEVDGVFGAAIRFMGPEKFLHILPLNIEYAGQQGVEIRSYLLPLLAANILHTNLHFFASYFVPLADSLKEKQSSYLAKSRDSEAKVYETLFYQIWSLLPGFCTYPRDLSASFKFVGPKMGDILKSEATLRPMIASSLRLLIEKNQQLSKLPNIPDDLIRIGYSSETVTSNLNGVSFSAKFFLPLLFNIYKDMEPSSRGFIGETIALFVSVSSVDVLSMLYNQLMQSLREQALGRSLQHSLFDLALFLLERLPEQGVTPLFEIVINELTSAETIDHTQIKKCYRVLAKMTLISTCKPILTTPANFSRISSHLVSTVTSSPASAKPSRLTFIHSLINLLPSSSISAEFVSSLLPEVIASVKEVNERSRLLAYDILIQLGEKSFQEEIVSESQDQLMSEGYMGNPGLESYFTMVCAGLVAETPFFVSATVNAASRLLFDFKDLLSATVALQAFRAVLLLLSSPNKEIVKSSLNFIKVFVAVTDASSVEELLSDMVPSVLGVSAIHKTAFKTKVRHILERLVKSVGITQVERAVPEEHKKLIVNIRKRRERLRRKKSSASHDEPVEAVVESKPNAKSAYDNSYEDIVYGSESELDSEAEDLEGLSDEEDGKGRKGKGKKRGGHKGNGTWIKEVGSDGEDVMDFLDKKAVSRVLASKPRHGMRTAPSARSDFVVAADGRYVFEEDSDNDSVKSAMTTGTSRSRSAASTAENHYLASVNNKDGYTRVGMRIKFSQTKKRGRGDGDSDVEMDLDTLIDSESGPQKRSKKVKREPVAIGAEYRSKKAAGDVKRPGKPDPFAYIPLSAKIVGNRKKSVKLTSNARMVHKKKGPKKHK